MASFVACVPPVSRSGLASPCFLWRLAWLLPGVVLALVSLPTEGADPSAAAGAPGESRPVAGVEEWFVHRLKGDAARWPGADRLSAGEVAAAQARLWTNYRSAALQLGWDKEIAVPAACPQLPPYEEIRKLPREQRPKLPKFEPTVLPCGTEKMPYLFFSRGDRPTNGWPLFIQTHGGGSTGEKLAHPHAWEVNTRDWQNQVGVCLFMFPEGLYFVPRMANDNRGRWYYRHNHVAFDHIIRRAILFRDVDANRVYMMGISEGAYGTESMTPFWADRFAGGVAMAGGAGGGERLYNLRNTPFRNDTGAKDTMFDRIKLATQVHEFLAALKETDPAGYDHKLEIHPGGHAINYQPGPAWIATKVRNPRPDKVCWYNHAVDKQRRTDFSWLSVDQAPERDTLIIAQADRGSNTVVVTAEITLPPAEGKPASKKTATPAPPESRAPYSGATLTLHLDDGLVDLDKPVTVILNGRRAFHGVVERKPEYMADDIVRHGDPGRIFPARLPVKL